MNKVGNVAEMNNTSLDWSVPPLTKHSTFDHNQPMRGLHFL